MSSLSSTIRSDPTQPMVSVTGTQWLPPPQPPDKSRGKGGSVATAAAPSVLSNTSSQRRNSGLTTSLYGYSAAVFIATCDYKTQNGLDQENKLESMDTSQDIKRMQHLAQGLTKLLKDNLFPALNEHMTLEKLKKQLKKLRPLLVPKFIYLGGHSEWDPARQEFAYLPNDYAQNGKDSLPRRLPSKELSQLLINPTAGLQTTMILVTDFCSANNFLGLPWILQQDDKGNFFWDKSEESDSGIWTGSHKILHFTAGAKGQETYTFGKGSIFNSAFVNAECTGGISPISLSNRQRDIRLELAKFLSDYNGKPGHCGEKLEQEPQVYASERFDLNDPKTLRDLLHDH